MGNSSDISSIQIHSTDTQYVVSFDKGAVEVDAVLKFIEWMKLEYLIKKGEFDPSIDELGEKIKADWWAKNKEWFLNPKRG